MDNKKFKKGLFDSSDNVEETTETIDVETVEEVKTIYGVVSSCGKLNVRKEPSIVPNNIIRILDLGTFVTVDVENSTEDFYKICCSDGLEGYCMRDFITIND